MNSVPYMLNWLAGWTLLLGGFVSGAVLGLRFDREDFLGGYGSLPRRLVRLGHVALAALGMLNLLFSLSPLPAPGTAVSLAASWLLVIGGATMPLVCFLSAWRAPMRRLFPLPVACLLAAVVLTLWGGLS